MTKKRKRQPNIQKNPDVGFSHDTMDEFCEKILSTRTMNAMKEIGSKTFIQDQGVVTMALLEGRDVLGVSRTGNLDTYAFLVPIMNLVHLTEAKSEHGTIVIIICPTKDSAIETYSNAKLLWKNQTDSLVQLVICNKSSGDSKSILVTTPESLVNHLLKERAKSVYNCYPMFLVFQEADYILKHNYEALHRILRFLPIEIRQTAIFSSTYSDDIVELANSSCKAVPVYIDVDNANHIVTQKRKLLLGYSFVQKDQRFTHLYYFLKIATEFSKKTIVFFSSPQSVEFHSKLLRCFGIKCVDTKNNHYSQTTAILNFWNAKEGILLCTDVPACDLDIPCMDWIVQYELPQHPTECVLRVHEPTFGQGPRGDAVFFLNVEEKKFVECLKNEKMKPRKMEFDIEDEDDVARRHSYLVDDDEAVLHNLAKDAFMSYIKAYHSHTRQDLFDVSKLDVKGIAQSFGFSFIPMKHEVESLLGRLID